MLELLIHMKLIFIFISIGVCSNNVTKCKLKLKLNKYNWVKQKAYSVTKDFNEIDLR